MHCMLEKIMAKKGDFVGGILALFCALHCMAMPIILSVSTMSNIDWLEGTWIEWGLIVSSVGVSGITLALSWQYRHGKSLPAKTAILGFLLFWLAQQQTQLDSHLTLSALGGSLIALAHLWNHVLSHDASARPSRVIRSAKYLFPTVAVCMFLYLAALRGVMGPPAPDTKQELLQRVWQVEMVSAD